MEKQRLIRENFPSHQFIHLRLFEFNEYPPYSWDAHQSTVAGLLDAGLVESPWYLIRDPHPPRTDHIYQRRTGL